MGCDRQVTGCENKLKHFYSHIPCGMWRLFGTWCNGKWNFYSHIPCGMWQCFCSIRCIRGQISTHTSRVGCDLFGLFSVATAIYFYSHIPCGMWLLRLYHLLVEMYFYSHIPCGMWLFLRKYWYAGDKFLLTHPVWDVTSVIPFFCIRS